MRKLLRFFFHHFYHNFAWTYDFVAALVSVGRWNEWVFAALYAAWSAATLITLGLVPARRKGAARAAGL